MSIMKQTMEEVNHYLDNHNLSVIETDEKGVRLEDIRTRKQKVLTWEQLYYKARKYSIKKEAIK